MADAFSTDILLKVVAQICQMIGFEKITTSALYLLVDILREFIRDLGRIARLYAEHCGRSDVNLSDLSVAFHSCGIYPKELSEFVLHAGPLPQSLSVPKYPVALNILYPCNRSPVNEPVNNNGTVDVREPLRIKISLTKIKKAKKTKMKSTRTNKSKKSKKNRERKNE